MMYNMQILYNIYVSVGNLRVDEIPASSFPSQKNWSRDPQIARAKVDQEGMSILTDVGVAVQSKFF